MQQTPKQNRRIVPIKKVNPLIVKALRKQYPDEKITHVEFVTTCEGNTRTQELFAVCKD